MKTYNYIRTVIPIFALFILTSPGWALETVRVSVSSNGSQGTDTSVSPSISADGRYIAFVSDADNLVPGDTNEHYDYFVHDRQTGQTQRVSVSSTGEQAMGSSRFTAQSLSLSADGRFVAFSSSADNLVPGDTNDRSDIFVHDLQTQQTHRVSVSSNGLQGTGYSNSPSISADGRYVAFESFARNLAPNDGNTMTDVFVHDRVTGLTEMVSRSAIGGPGFYGGNSNQGVSNPVISSDGRYVVYVSIFSNLVPSDTNDAWDVFLHDRQSGLTKRVNVTSTGEQSIRGSWTFDFVTLSGDGRYIAFESSSPLVPEDTDHYGEDVFVHDQLTGLTELISVSSIGDQSGGFGHVGMSADGRYIAFASFDNLMPDDTNNEADVYVHDRQTQLTERVSLSTNGEQANEWSSLGSLSMSADGRFIAYGSLATNLVDGDTNDAADVFVTDNPLLNSARNLSVQLRSTSGAVNVDEYIRFRAKLTNNGPQALTNCQAKIVNKTIPAKGYGKLFNFYTWPLGVSNPEINQPMVIEPGKTVQMNLAIRPRDNYRGEVKFIYSCNETPPAITIPYVNTVHLVAKSEPLISEDYLQLKNSNNNAELMIDRNNGKYWTIYVLKVTNTGTNSTSTNLTTISDSPLNALNAPRLCEPIDPAIGNWSCITANAEELVVDLAAKQQKKILVFVHANHKIDRLPVKNRIIVMAHDQTGEVVAKNSIGVFTIN